MLATVLIVDDEQSNLDSLSRIFQREGYAVLCAADGVQGLDILRNEPVNVVLTDLVMPRMGGTDLLKATHSIAPEVEIIVMTAYGTVENAVDAMKQGAYDFVTKPLKRAHVVSVVKRALERQQLVVENRKLRAQLKAKQQRTLIGNSLLWRRTMDLIRQAAPSSATMLLIGESGTGKELLARALHDESARAGQAFVAVNCAAIPESILEAELFGHERGAFTGAIERKNGRFSLADKGTLFLDEVGELSPHVQVKLLRVLQDGEFDRLGGKTERVDIRVVAATNRDLAAEVSSGRFREDLFYRLNVISVHVPPLRDRREDIPLLTDFFFRLYADKNEKSLSGVSSRAMEKLCAYDWPGNVRQLENVVQRAVVLTRGTTIEEVDLPQEIGSTAADGANRIMIPVGMPLDEVERRLVRATLRHAKGDKRLAAQLLGVGMRTIYRRLEDMRDEQE